MSDKIFVPVNPNASEGVRNVMKYLSDISGEKIVTGLFGDLGYRFKRGLLSDFNV